MPDAVGAFQAPDVLFYFGAGKAGRDRVLRIALYLKASLDIFRYHQRTGIRTIHGAGGDDFLGEPLVWHCL